MIGNTWHKYRRLKIWGDVWLIIFRFLHPWEFMILKLEKLLKVIQSQHWISWPKLLEKIDADPHWLFQVGAGLQFPRLEWVPIENKVITIFFWTIRCTPQIWEENWGASYSLNVAYLVVGVGGASGAESQEAWAGLHFLLKIFFSYFPPLKPRCVLWFSASYSLKNMVNSRTPKTKFFFFFYLTFFIFFFHFFIVVRIELSPFSHYHFTLPNQPSIFPSLALSMGPLYMFLDDPFPSFPFISLLSHL